MNKSILKDFCIGLDLVMNMKKILLAICICVLSIPLSSYTYYAKTNDNLIIVAHPDDETIWAGEHLIRGSYTVLCITNGNNKTRKAEFERFSNRQIRKVEFFLFLIKPMGKEIIGKVVKMKLQKK